MTQVERVRLGGIVKSLVVEVKSLNRSKWNMAVFLSMGMFYWIMGEPNQVCVMILGKSGRFLILNRTHGHE